jgi:hypothetical protein
MRIFMVFLLAIGAGGALALGTTAPASKVTVNYPFQFITLQPVVRLLVKGSTVGAPITMTASAVMRNE